MAAEAGEALSGALEASSQAQTQRCGHWTQAWSGPHPVPRHLLTLRQQKTGPWTAFIVHMEAPDLKAEVPGLLVTHVHPEERPQPQQPCYALPSARQLAHS